MIKRDVTYVDYDGNKRTERCWFNLNRTELMEVALSLPDSVFKDSEDRTNMQIADSLFSAFGTKGLFNFTKNLVLKSYGVKTPDGKGFAKSEEERTKFEQSLVFDELFTGLISDDNELADFINGVLPISTTSKLINKISETDKVSE